ncbi:MAG: YaaL family protein [Clostridia bacterium]|nr:YaaL family protein [Clostridia bacterium]
MYINAQKNINIKLGKVNFFGKLIRLLSVKEKSEIISSDQACENLEIVENIRDAKSEWIYANINFNYADEQELVDYYTYKIKACQVRYEYYIKKAKEKGIRLDSLDTAESIYGRDHLSY